MVTRLALVLLLLASVARAQLAGNPLAAASSPTFTGVVTFTTDPQVQGSLNAGDIVCNGVGTNAGICHGGTNNGGTCVINANCPGGGICGFTGYRVQMDRPSSVSGTPAPPAQVGRQLISGWSFDPANRSVVTEFVGDGVNASKQYFFLNGHLGSGSTFGTPTLTSSSADPFGLESTDSTMSLITASAGTDQTLDKPLIVSSNGIALGSATRPARMLSVTFTNLGTPPVGTVVYCSDCAPASSPCTGSSTGTIANRINGGTPAWKCL